MDKRNYLAFDIEITKIVKQGASWLGERPLGISVAVTTMQRPLATRYWYGQGRPDGRPWEKMPKAQVRILVDYLKEAVQMGFTLLTWNGLHFDLNILGEESGLWDECRALAMGMVDPMFHFYWMHGYPVNLQAVVNAMTGQSKTGIGADAPVKWALGLYDEVLEYCANDARILLDVTLQIEERGWVEWFSHAGRLREWHAGKLREWELPEGRLLTVREVLELPAPVNPWMPIENFTDWLLKGGS